MDAGFAPILFLLLISMTAVQSQIQRGPANALKRAGESVTLVCVTVNKNCDQVEWQKVEGLQSPKLVYRNGIGMVNNDLYPPQRYSVNSTGGCSLTITQLEINDSGRFICVHIVAKNEEERGSILVVIDVTESCMSNVTSNALDKGDGYRLWCAIKIPAKSVEPSNVTLSFHNKTVGETETVDENQPLTVTTTLIGTAKNENIMRVCRASFPPSTQANYDDTTATLDVCTKQWIVSPIPPRIQKCPMNALKKGGDSVTLECLTVSKNCDKVEWQKVEGLQSPKLVYRNGQGMLNNDVYSPQRYSVNSTGGCSLTITQLEINDSGRFICLQAVDSWEETRSSILVVINVTESCMSNVTSNALDKGDGYRLWCAIKIPAKSVEPSNVTLSFHNKTVGETETTDVNQPLTVTTTLIGIAKNENITLRGCRASFPPNTQTNFDSTSAFLDVFTTQQFIVSYPVENIVVSPRCPYYKGHTVRCTANGHPPPTFKWTHLKSGVVVDGDTLEIKGDAGDKYTCTATNTFKGKETSRNITIEICVKPTQIQRGPTNALKKVGDSVRLECVTSSNNCDEVDWLKVEGQNPPKRVYRHGSGMLHNDLYPTRRYSVSSTGGCSLTIRQLEINDSGRFICLQAAVVKEDKRGSILVVINVTGSCMSNVTSNVLAKDDGYSLRCAINIPAKSVEPSNVILSFHDKTVGETETTDENQPLTVKTTLTGIATNENITPRVCRASFLPTTEANYDSTIVILDVCTTQSLTVSHPVESNTLLTRGSSDRNECLCPCPVAGVLDSTLCRSFLSRLKRDVFDKDTRVIMDDEGKTCTFKATKFEVRVDAQKVSTPLPSPPEAIGPGGIVGITFGILGSGIVGAASFAGLRDERSRLYDLLHSKKKKNEKDGETAAYVPVTDSASSGPVKPPQDG